MLRDVQGSDVTESSPAEDAVRGNDLVDDDDPDIKCCGGYGPEEDGAVDGS